ncbi:MAG: 6-phosphogluconate dehydrogenase, NAD-binding protein [Conexibacter sp.]|nr:6-phosphogluconate dehydrogenase, NAD-binding protein [Conexibacter sp.]
MQAQQLQDRPHVGFIGMGRMGRPMVGHLLDAGFPVTVYNRTVERCAPVAERGAVVAETPAAVAAAADVTITMIADGAAAEAVYHGDEGVLAGLSAGDLVLEMSTIGPEVARRLATSCAERGAELLDSPVSGSIPAARDAQLVAMVGGEAAAFQRARPVLEAMTRAQHHLGASGAGAAMKLSVNALIGVTNLALSEVLVAAERSGIPRDRALDVLADSAIGSPYITYKREAFLDPDSVEVFFTVRLLKKDLGLALELGRSTDVPMLSIAVADEALTLAAASGYGEDDVVRMADVLRGRADALEASR